MPDTMTELDPDLCWAAVAARDPACDGRFLFGVTTTGVFCRPSCPSRAPRRENVRFFRDAAEARAASLRPCKRCRPDQASPDERQRGAIARACARLGEDEPVTLDALARGANMSRHHFHRVFTRTVGTTPGAYARTAKVRRLSRALDDGSTVTDAIYAAGFGAPSRAYAAAKTGLGMTPGARRRGAAGETIRYALAETPAGWAILAASERGICAAALGEDPRALAAELRRIFPAATLIADEGGLRDWMAAFVDRMAAPAGATDLPLDIRGTAFQARVWEALRRIPPGETASYAAVADAIGAPAAVRAVAGACASNAIAVLIPCHRVVRSDGSLSGYRWGTERKRALLDAERREAAARGPDG